MASKSNNECVVWLGLFDAMWLGFYWTVDKVSGAWCIA